MLFLMKSYFQFLVVLCRFFIWITPEVSFDLKSLTYFCSVHNNSFSAVRTILSVIAWRLANAFAAYFIIVDFGAL